MQLVGGRVALSDAEARSKRCTSSMSGDVVPALENANWIEELQKKVFEECVAESHQLLESGVSSSGDSTAPTAAADAPVPVNVIIDNIHRSFAQIPHFRQRNDFLDELRKSLNKVARGTGNQVSWCAFRESSERWFHDLVNLVREDTNNNVHKNSSDVPTKYSEKDKPSMEEHSCSDAIEEDLTSSSMNQLDAITSCYSFNSSSMGFGTTDSMLESSDDIDRSNEDVADVELKVRIRRYTEETASLKDELLRAEEAISTLERDIKLTAKNLEQTTKKYTRLKKENEDQREMLTETERREEACKLDLRKLEKKYSALKKKVEELEKENENILNLKSKIEELRKENSSYIKQISEFKVKYDKKIIEYDCLKDQFNELQSNTCQLEKSYEKNLQEQQAKIQELQNINTELQSRMNKSDNSSRLSLTPPPYNQINIHSTPYNSSKIRHQDSLFTELKASGFNVNDARLNEIKEEVSFYKEEIANIAEEVDEALRDIAASRNEICAPNMQLVELDDIQTLKQKITSLIKLVKSCSVVKVQAAPRMGKESREKPDILPETKKNGCGSGLSDDQLFGSERHDLIGSVTSSMTSFCENRVSTTNKSTSPLPEVAGFDESSGVSEAHEQEIIVPIVEALNRIIELKGTDEEENTEFGKERHPKQKSIFTATTANRNTDWFNLGPGVSKFNAPKYNKKTEPHVSSKTFNNAKGDGPHCDLVEPTTFDKSKPLVAGITDMKTLKAESSDYNPSPDGTVAKIDTRFVTCVRPNPEATYVVSPLVTSTAEKSELDQSKFNDVKSEGTYYNTPLANTKICPRRKLSVYHRSFDVDSLEKPVSLLTTSSEKRRSISTPDVQEAEYAGYRGKPLQPLESSATRKQLLNTYRCANNSDSSNSPSPKKNETPTGAIDDDLYCSQIKPQPTKQRKPVIIAPTKFKLPDSTENQTSTVELNRKPRPVISQGILQKSSLFNQVSSNSTEQQSRILSSSSNLIRKETNNGKDDEVKINFDSCTVGSSISSQPSSSSTINLLSTDNSSSNCSNLSDNIFSPEIEKYDQTYSTKGVEETKKTEAVDAATTTPSEVVAPAVTPVTVAVREEPSLHSSSSSAGSYSGVVVVGNKRTPAVGRAMSSGEDSSAESECDARSLEKTAPAVDDATSQKQQNQPSAAAPPAPRPPALLDRSLVEVDNKLILGRRRSNSCTDADTREDKVETPLIVNGGDKKDECQKVTSNSSPQEIVKEDETPKAFPSWTDEKLQESGLANFPDIDSEINENLSEEEQKKKYTAFSVGLSTDRMTLSKRMILSRRHRDQAEKNFNNEVIKMQQDIKELAPLCYDSESLERVERARQQLEMVARCAHRISCSAETLGAVHQERRVSRAVLLADKYLQTLRSKCEKLAGELAETKKILAENNIVLEENLSEMGDDVPRVRYRAVPNNNRTMMARRRASIATISRPLMGSNQDISKELPRQRNSVSGRVPGLRRPSLCYETPKWEIEKLDRTDSSSSMSELRDIYEQTESRRHSREENNNVIRTSINNLSTITSEHTEEEEIWSNPREDMAPELANDNEVNSLELVQQHGHPFICWLINRYATWKPMIYGIFIAFLLGIFMGRVVSSSRRSGPPISWWSIEEIFNQYAQIENEKHSVPRPI